jgi:FixJ family two-component response regulator
MGSEGRMAPPATDGRSLPAGVLVVDDERPIVDLLTRYLGQHGFRALGAYSPDQARELVLSDPAIGVVISDVRMPGQSGLALAEELLAARADAEALEIVLISGAGLPEGSHVATIARAFDVLRKPFRPSEVAAAARRALKSAETRRNKAALGLSSDTLRAIPPGRLQEAIGTVAEGLRGPLLPLLAAAEAIAHGPMMPEAELRAAARGIREEGLRLLALLDAASATRAGAGPGGSGLVS